MGGLSVLLLGVIPAGRETWNTLTSVRQLQKEIKILKDKAALLSGLDGLELTEQMRIAASAIPIDASLPTLFTTIEGIANQTGVAVTELTVAHVEAVTASATAGIAQNERDKSGARSQKFTLVVQGQLQQLVDSVTKTLNVRRIFRLKDFEFTFNRGAIPEVKMVMEAFFAPLPRASRTSASPLEPLSDQEFVILGDLGSLVETEFNVPAAVTSFDTVKPDPFAP